MILIKSPHFLVKRLMALVIPGAIITSILVILCYAMMISVQVTADQKLEGLPRTTYDLLVRPPDSISEIEEKYGLVRPNHLSGISGGISLEQYESIKSMQGVEVAAPVAVLGYLPRNNITLYILDPLTEGIYQVSATDSISDGITTFTWTLSNPFFSFLSRKPYDLIADHSTVGQLIFSKNITTASYLFTKNPSITVSFPSAYDRTLLVAIDPEQEAKLISLDQYITNGTYLPQETELQLPNDSTLVLPVLYNLHDYTKQTITVDLQKLDYELDPGASYIEQLEAVPELEILKTLPKQPSMTVNIPVKRQWLAPSDNIAIKDNEVVDYRPTSHSYYGPLLSPNSVEYREIKGSPITIDSSMLILEAIPIGETSSTAPTPWLDDLATPEITDWMENFKWTLTPEIQYRSLLPENEQRFYFMTDINNSGSFEIVSPEEFGQGELNPVPLETYYPPLAVLKYDEQGNPLAVPQQLNPTLNAEGYLVSPPDLLISLSSAKLLFENACVDVVNQRLVETACEMDGNFISAIRVRVGGIDEMDEAAQQKIEALAKEIVEKTGLHVDIMVGSSPQPVLVHLAGSGSLPGQGYVEEQWIRKGVVTSIRSGLSGFQSILFYLLLVYTFGFLALLSHNQILGRTSEIGMLVAFGWRRKAIFKRLSGEAFIAAGVTLILASSAVLMFIHFSGYKINPSLLGLSALIIFTVFISAVFLPIARISVRPPILNITRGEINQAARVEPFLSLRGYVFNELSRKPLRSILTSASVGLSTFLLAFLLMAANSLDQTLNLTLLGKAIRIDLQPQVLAMAAILMLVSVLVSLLMFHTNLRGRAAEIATLSAFGWRKGTLSKTLAGSHFVPVLVGITLGILLALLASALVFNNPAKLGPLLGQIFVYCFALPLLLNMIGALESIEALVFRKLENRVITKTPQNRLALVISVLVVCGLITSGLLIDFSSSRPAAPSGSDIAIQPVNAAPAATPTPVVLSALPHYQLDLLVDDENMQITGSETLTYNNQTGSELDRIVLRLYPNAPVFGEDEDAEDRLSISAASVDGIETSAQLNENRSVVELELPKPLRPNQTATIAIEFTLQRYPFSEEYRDLWKESSFFPMLAVYDQSGWRKDVCSYCGDIVYSQTANFDYTITIPAEWQVASGGQLVSKMPLEDEQIKYTFQSPAVRDLALSFSPSFTRAEGASGSTRIIVYTYKDKDATNTILEDAQKALQYFSTEYGSYPYDQLTIVGMKSANTAGMEYPAYISLSYNLEAEKYPLLLAHEVAHQWWYGVVGNDIFNEPWLDEALSQYSAMKYIKVTYGVEKYYALLAQMQSDLEFSQKQDIPIISPVTIFAPNGSGYQEVIYYKGALRLIEIESLIGEENFSAALRDYYSQYKYGIARGKDLRSILQQYTSVDIAPFFEY